MLRYVVSRLLQGVVIVWFVTLLVFVLVHLTPGDPILILKGDAVVSEEVLDQMRARWGLDRPLHVQYLVWLTNMLQGDFGRSLSFGGVPVSTLIRQALPNTLALNFLAYMLAVVIAVPTGVVAATRHNTIQDYVGTTFMTIGAAIPNFWLALLLIIVFSLQLRWFPATGAGTWKHYVLPVVSLAFGQAALLARLTRAIMLEVLGQDYVRTARAKGLGERTVLWRHVFRNGAVPLVTIIGYRAAYFITGLVIIETVFAWPGLGRLAVSAIFRRDYFTVQAITLLTAVAVVVVNLLTDLLYGYLDPRIRYD